MRTGIIALALLIYALPLSVHAGDGIALENQYQQQSDELVHDPVPGLVGGVLVQF